MKPLSVSGGDPAGIGPEIAARAWSIRTEAALPPFYVITDSTVLAARAIATGCSVPIREISGPEQACDAFAEALPVISLPCGHEVKAGVPDPAHAGAITGAIERAVADTMDGRASAVVTLPIAKRPLYEAGFAFPGHTEYLAHLSADATGLPVRPVMMLAGPKLRTVPVTIHIPLRDVAAALTPDLLEETIRITAADMRRRFGLARPRLAVAGLNPHAGEGGSLGREEIEVIGPVLDRLRTEGHDIAGPLPADTMFHDRARSRYDVAICMYHDQALIPAKALGFDDAVNVTLGLPFIRTSPDHGTAFDIAGKGIARPDSFIAALRMAAAMAAHEGADA